MYFDQKYSATIGNEAWERIRSFGLSPDPVTFDVWFNYVAGHNPSLNEELDALIDSGSLSRDNLEEVFHRHLSPMRNVERLLGAGDDLREEVGLAAELTDTAIMSASGYSDALHRASTRLGRASDERAVASIVASLIQSTEEIKKTNSRLQEQLKHSEAQILSLRDSIEILHVESMTDPLTDVANRKLFEHSLAQMIFRAEKTDTPLSLVIIDVDNFKNFNDKYGHRVGDAVLRLVAMALKRCVRGSDLIARYGGDEFAVLLPRTSAKDALTVGEHIRCSVMEKELVRRSTGETLGRINVSVGIAEHIRGESADSMVERADTRLYAAKRNGRNCVVGQNLLSA